MPPAAQDNQGLKIAVAVFVTLSVVLAVATYFGFSNASFYSEKMEQAQKDANQAKTAQSTLQRQFEELKELAGYPKVDDSAVAAKIKSDRDEQNKAVASIRSKMDEVLKQIESAPGADLRPEVQKIYESANTAADSFTSEPNRTQVSAINRLIELQTNLELLLANVAGDYAAARKELEAANQIAQAKVQVEADARDQAQADLDAERDSHTEQRQGLLTRLDELQTRNSQLATENNALKEQLAQVQAEAKDRFDKLMANFRQAREALEKNETILEKADGRITFVDYSRNEVRTDLGRRQGAHAQLTFAVFDRDAQGLPTDSPKATIELIRVDDNGSVGRILRQMRTIDPIRPGDQIYSPGFGERPRTFALIGKIDLDRDGRDDREELKRMIRSFGGEVVYDLPPPGLGSETGELTPATSWYILDEQDPIRVGAAAPTGASPEEEQAFREKLTRALQVARDAGVRPLTLERLRKMLGFNFGQRLPGRVEGADRGAIDRLTNPRGRTVPTPPAPADEPADDENPF